MLAPFLKRLAYLPRTPFEKSYPARMDGLRRFFQARAFMHDDQRVGQTSIAFGLLLVPLEPKQVASVSCPWFR